MMQDEKKVECQNDKSKLLVENDDEPPYSHSLDSRSNQDDLTQCEVSNDLSSSDQESTPGLFPEIPKRFIILILVSLANFNMYCIRMCVSVTIVAMTRGESRTNSSMTPLARPREAEFHWDKQLQGTILASIYWSYTAVQVPAGLLCIKYGGSILLRIAILVSSVLTLTTPFIVRQNAYAFIALRVLEGAFLGLVFAADITIISKWAPVYERSIFVTVAGAGNLFGAVFANSLSGILAGSSWGWPSVFYYFGVQGILWYLLWSYHAYEGPNDHPNITKAELDLIRTFSHSKLLSCSDIPWRCILSSLPVWAIIVAQFTNGWAYYTFMLTFPSYLKDVLDFDIATVGLASSLPYVISGLVVPSWGYFIDVSRSKKFITTTNSRKLSEFICAGVSGVFTVGIVHTSSVTTAILTAVIAITLTNFATSGPTANIVEIAPKYSGVISGIGNLACNINGFISPEVVGALTVNEVDDPHHQWSIVFHVTGGVGIVGMIFYIWFASSEKQYWSEL